MDHYMIKIVNLTVVDENSYLAGGGCVARLDLIWLYIDCASACMPLCVSY